MTLSKDSEQYQLAKAAHDLVQSPAWKLLIRPGIDKAMFAEEATPITSLENAFLAAQRQGSAKFAKSLLNMVEHHTNKFANFK